MGITVFKFAAVISSASYCVNSGKAVDNSCTQVSTITVCFSMLRVYTHVVSVKNQLVVTQCIQFFLFSSQR